MDFDERLERPRPAQTGWQRPDHKSSGSGGGPNWGKLALAAMLLALIVLPFTPFAKKQIQETFRPPARIQIEKEIVEVKVPTPPPPLPDKFVPNKLINLAELFNGFQLKNEVAVTEGQLASAERNDDSSYTISFQINIRSPKPASTFEDMVSINAELPKLWPQFAELMRTAKVSGFFHYLYEEKERDIQRDITRFDRILSRHNYYDLETVLELQHPTTKRRALLMQGEMDVVSDGTDGDRLPTLEDAISKSPHFQPSTSYAWKKLTATPNPLLPRYETQMLEAKEKLKSGNAEEKKSAKGKIDYLNRMIADLKSKSFLIAQEDPFVVIPLSMRTYQGFNDYAPGLGDYVIVIYQNRLLPAIIGDYGPREKTGEASLRIAKELNARASSYSRPISDLKVSYLIFPGSAEKPPTQPKLEHWRKRCQELIDQMGGIGPGYALHTWEDRFNKPAVPSVAPAAGP